MKKIISILLSLTLFFGMLPPEMALAAEETGEDKSKGWVYDEQNQLPTQVTEYTAGSGTITWEPTTVYDEKLQRDKAVSGRLILNNAAISVDTAAAKKGIHVPVDTELVLKGSNTITMSQAGTAIMITDPYYGGMPSLTITGEGSLTINAAGGGNGIEVRNEINVIDGPDISVSCSNGVGMFTTSGGISISDSTVKVRIADNANSYGAIRASTNGTPVADLTIKNSHVTAINPGGTSMMSSGSISFTNSDVVVIGKSALDDNVPVKGILDFAEYSGGTVNISGGTLYAENKYENTGRYNYGFDLPLLEKLITATDSAVIYYKHDYRQVIQSGNNIQYAGCAYDEITDKVTEVGNAFVMGTVEWNENIVFGPNTKINNYNQILSANGNVAGHIIIPSGATVTIPSGCGLYNYGTLTNNGTLVVENVFQNVVQSTIKNSTGALINNGEINIKVSGDVRSTGTLTNNGTLSIEGIYYNFPTGKISGGSINGVVLEYNASASPKQFFFVAHGDAKLYEADPKYMGNTNNTLLVGAATDRSKKQTMTVPADATLTIQKNCVLDASQPTLGLSWDSLDAYLSVEGKIVVNGTLKLPPNPDQEKLEKLLTHISGTGQIIIGKSTAYPITVTGGTANKNFATQGTTVTLHPATPEPETQFLRWEISPKLDINDDGNFEMPGEAVTATAICAYIVTFNTQGGSEVDGQTVESGKTATEPAKIPTRAGYIFDGWYTGTDCKTDYDFNRAVTGPLTIYAKWLKILPSPPGDENRQFQVVMDTGIREVPDELKNIYQSAEALENAMRVEITQTNTGIPSENTAVYDVSLMVSEDGGKTWKPATKDNFPADGLTVTLPYPEDTNSGYEFTAVHMFTQDNSEDKKAGDTESPVVTNTASGVQFTVTGLSPISLGWVKKSGGGTGGGNWITYYKVDIKDPENGSIGADRKTAPGGGKVILTVEPDEGYEVARVSVVDGRGEKVKLEESGEKLWFLMPFGDVTVKAEFSPIPPPWENPFGDVREGQWYYKAVEFAHSNGLMEGYSSSKFGPNEILTRAHFAQILYNKEGQPRVDSTGKFTDVNPGKWYANAVNWAAAEGIVAGIGGGKFAPDHPIARQDLAVMLWRYAEQPEPKKNELDFTDSDKVSGYAWKALCWANEHGIVGGKGNGVLDPRGNATRAEAAQMVMKYVSMDE